MLQWNTPGTVAEQGASQQLVDRFGRVHSELRISVTDRCNLRCTYCMPAEVASFLPRAELLSFDEISRFVRVAATLGIRKLRLTGGEPLVRPNLDRLIARLVALDGIEEVALTTNGLLLAEQAAALKRAGLARLNVSLDALEPEAFRAIARRDGLERVLAGLSAARAAGFEGTRLNAVALRGASEEQVVPLVRFARDEGLELRFIEFMPLDADHAWQRQQVLSGAELRASIEAALGPLVPVERNDPSQPSTDFRFADGRGRVGFIASVTEPFCGSCNRIRLTADGQVRNCLFATDEWDARRILRSDGDDQQLVDLLHSCVGAKRAGHGIDGARFVPPERAMYRIGG